MKKHYINNIPLLILAMICAASCTKYNIVGTCGLENVDGHTLYLKGVVGDELKNIDSCEVVHGKFSFKGSLDSVCVVTLCIDDDPIMPIVLEDGEVNIELGQQRQICKGTPLNDTLNAFNKRYENLMMRYDDLSHQQSQAIMNGDDMDVVNRKLESQHSRLVMEEDRMISDFIAENFDNCLGPYVFQVATSGYEYPVLMPWIEALMTKATDTFRTSPYVKEYMEMAKQNQDIMMGVAETPTTLPQPPTPNEMAKSIEPDK